MDYKDEKVSGLNRIKKPLAVVFGGNFSTDDGCDCWLSGAIPDWIDLKRYLFKKNCQLLWIKFRIKLIKFGIWIQKNA